jgi:glutamate N-acetyltransferase/amino-acid N-acetyltransferase
MKLHDFRVSGFLFAGISAGIKKNGRKDLGLIYSEVPSQVAGIFTTNAVKAAPVRVGMERIKRGVGQAVIINSGNANACTGKQGLKDARKISSWVARGLGIDEKLILPASTGVIGVPLPLRKIEDSVPELIQSLSPDGWMNAVEAIMTTDAFPKIAMAACRLKGKKVKLCGMVKGAGMIRPNMATMLSFLVTDANIKASLLQKMLTKAAEVSYNSITVDGDTSTNDTVLLFANGTSGHPQLTHMDRDGEAFQSMLSRVCQNLAKSVVKDGEGATKLVEILIMGAKNREDAKKAAYAIAHSPLVKTAFFGEDANWGRILCALGHSGARILPNRVDLYFNKFPIVKDGMGMGGRFEEEAGKVLKEKSFRVTVDLHQGKGTYLLFTTDLSFEYIKINASYRS